MKKIKKILLVKNHDTNKAMIGEEKEGVRLVWCFPPPLGAGLVSLETKTVFYNFAYRSSPLLIDTLSRAKLLDEEDILCMELCRCNCVVD